MKYVKINTKIVKVLTFFVKNDKVKMQILFYEIRFRVTESEKENREELATKQPIGNREREGEK